MVSSTPRRGRRFRTPRPARFWAAGLFHRSTSEARARAAGASSTSRSCTSGPTSWCRTGVGGAVPGCLTGRRPLTQPWRRTGCARILSPSTSSFDRAKKLGIYAREGVPWAWLVDPLARTLEVLKLEGGHWSILATHADEEVVRAEPFEAIELELAALWGDVGGGPPSAD